MVDWAKVEKQQRGITLLELMVVVTVIGILAAIGYPTYVDQVLRSNRAEGKSMLQNAAALQERYFSNNNAYATTVAALGQFSPSGKCATTDYSETCLYQLDMPTATATAYELRVRPRNGQTRDNSKCSEMRLDNTGRKTGAGTQCNCNTAATCW